MSEPFQQIAQRCAAVGIRHVFGVTGSGSSLALINALGDHGVTFYPTAHEGAAGLMAGGACFDATCRAAALTIKGPGFANLLPAMLANRYESRPALTISEAYPDCVPDHQMHKRLAHRTACDPLVKSSLVMDSKGLTVDVAAMIASTETPGPVHIDLVPQPNDTGPDAPDAPLSPASDRAALDNIIDAINNSRRPVIVLGSWAMRAAGKNNWLATGVPIVTTAAAKGAVDESHPLAAGILTGEVSEYSPESGVLASADLVIGFGLRNSEVIKPHPFSAPLMLVDGEPLLASAGFSPATVLVTPADPNADIQAVLSALSKRNWGEAEVASWRSGVDRWILQDDWQAGRVFQRLNRQSFAGRPPRLVLDTGFFCTVGESLWRCADPGDAVGSGVGRFMGTAIPTAIGLSLADRNRAITCVVGDGGISPAIAELQLAARENLPIQFVHMSDGGYGSVAAFSNDSPASRAATRGSDTNWCQVAEGLDIRAERIVNMSQLDTLLTDWQPDHGPLFLSLAFEPDRYRQIAKALR